METAEPETLTPNLRSPSTSSLPAANTTQSPTPGSPVEPRLTPLPRPKQGQRPSFLDLVSSSSRDSSTAKIFWFQGKVTAVGTVSAALLASLNPGFDDGLRLLLESTPAGLDSQIRVPSPPDLRSSQVVGSIVAVWLIMITFPEAAHPPHLNVDIHRGTLIEGLLAFTIVTVSVTLKKKDPGRSAMKTWIKSISKVVLHLLGSDITGGMMNPAAAFGWAYVQGNYNTKEHLYVYWLAPIEATLLGVWACSLFIKPNKKEHSTFSSSLYQKKTVGWMDARGYLTKTEHSSSRLTGSMDMQFCFSPRCGVRNDCKKRTRTLYQNEAGVL